MEESYKALEDRSQRGPLLLERTVGGLGWEAGTCEGDQGEVRQGKR